MTYYSIIKLRLLFRFYRRNPIIWFREVWQQDGNQQLCCSGYECGCMGSCYIDQWEYALGDRP